ncbi:sugar transferase [Enterococcus hirae]|uniref:sugar transferase n=1 Tax=Enterococcus hirae TaxID=1354 RepID=UPI002EA709D4|nr:sugar transferase [Enterococcus hirae]
MRVIESIINRILAGIALLILSPLLILFSILLKIENPELSPFYTQTRIGKDQKKFTIYKLRSMKEISQQEFIALTQLNEAGEQMFKIKEDPRITPIGRIIRKTSIDELPQLINVIKGDMALVGPRPPLPNEVAKYTDYDLQRLTVLPGCTGLWQIGGRSDVSFEEMVDLDLKYIENKNLWLDLKILCLTVPAVLKMRGAY